MVAFSHFCALLLWIHSLNFVQNVKAQSCTLEDFKRSTLFDENFDLTTLAQSYNSGDNVRVRCKVGFRGFFKMICSNGQWFSYSDKCKAISCGHPGDALFADVRLVQGDDYVFGSQVLYTCHKGYQMTSLTNTRNCLEGGWDGHLPECEPQSCTLEDFKSSSLFDENFDLTTLDQSYNNSDSVRVRCKVGFSGLFILICSNGQWFSYGNKCKPISCGHPGDALFADVRLVQGDDYVFGSQVLYTCHKGYQMTSFTNTRNCLEGGWDGHLPECEQTPNPQ